MILAKDLTVGQEIWYRRSYQNENGKMEREYNRGTIHSISGKGRDTLAGVEMEDGYVYPVKPYDLYKDEFDMKMDKVADRFEDKMMDFAEKYVNQCTSLLKGVTDAAKNRLPQGTDFILNDVKLRMQMMGSAIKDRFMEHTDRFVEETKELTMDSIEKGLDNNENMEGEKPAFLGGENRKDTSANDDVDLTLTNEDLKFIQQEPGLKL